MHPKTHVTQGLSIGSFLHFIITSWSSVVERQLSYRIKCKTLLISFRWKFIRPQKGKGEDSCNNFCNSIKTWESSLKIMKGKFLSFIAIWVIKCLSDVLWRWFWNNFISEPFCCTPGFVWWDFSRGRSSLFSLLSVCSTITTGFLMLHLLVYTFVHQNKLFTLLSKLSKTFVSHIQEEIEKEASSRTTKNHSRDVGWQTLSSRKQEDTDSRKKKEIFQQKNDRNITTDLTIEREGPKFCTVVTPSHVTFEFWVFPLNRLRGFQPRMQYQSIDGVLHRILSCIACNKCHNRHRISLLQEVPSHNSLESSKSCVICLQKRTGWEQNSTSERNVLWEMRHSVSESQDTNSHDEATTGNEDSNQ